MYPLEGHNRSQQPHRVAEIAPCHARSRSPPKPSTARRNCPASICPLAKPTPQNFQSLTNFHRSIGKFYSKNFKLRYNSETCKCIGFGQIIVPTEAYFEHKPNPDLTPIDNEPFEVVETYVRVKAISAVSEIEIETDEKFSASELEVLSKNLI